MFTSNKVRRLDGDTFYLFFWKLGQPNSMLIDPTSRARPNLARLFQANKIKTQPNPNFELVELKLPALMGSGKLVNHLISHFLLSLGL